MENKPKVAVYARFANESSLKDEPITAIYCRTARACVFSINSQEAMLRKFAKENGHGNVSVYSDDGYSGLDFDRPAILRLQADIEAGLVGVVLVKDMSRISRNYLDTPKFLERVKSKGVVIRFVMDGFDYGEAAPLDEIRQAVHKIYLKQKRGAKVV
jgi:DNA invertase Pin-like site-specific DNA recombinase